MSAHATYTNAYKYYEKKPVLKAHTQTDWTIRTLETFN